MSSASLPTWPRAQAAELTTGRQRVIALYCTIAMVAAMYLLPFVRVLSGAPDEGIYLYDAQRALQGAIPGRGFVQENAPGAYYWLALFFRLFGTSMTTARMLLLFTGVGTAVVTFHLARRAGSSGIGPALFVLVTSIPLMPINSPHYDSNFFALTAFAVFLLGADQMSRGIYKRWPFVIAGLLAGWVSCILQQKGVLFLVAFIASTLFIHRRRGIETCLLMTGSFVFAVLAEVVPYIFWGALPDLFFSAVRMPLSGYHALNHVPYGFPLWTVWFPALFAQLRASAAPILALPLFAITSIPFLLMVSLPVVVGVLAYLWRSRVFGPHLLPYWITGYAMWLSEIHRQDLSHLRHGCKILVILFYVLCERYGPNVFKRFAFAATLGTLLMGLTTLNGALSAAQPVVSRRGIMYAQQRDPVVEFLQSHTRAGDYVFVHPYAPVYYFLADVRNPTRLSTIVDQRDNALIEEAVRDLDTKKPRYVVEDTRLLGDGMRVMFPAFQPPAPQDRVIDRYIDTHYHQIAAADGFRFMQRNAGA